MQRTLRRLLYIWGVRHPASGYVQGVNDLVTPFLAVFLSEHFETDDMIVWEASSLTEAQLVAAEADSYWCLCKLVERCGPLDTCNSSFTVVIPCLWICCIFHMAYTDCDLATSHARSRFPDEFAVALQEGLTCPVALQGAGCIHSRAAWNSAVFASTE